MKVKGVIFDVDGVLLDSMEIWTDLGARYLESIGKKPEQGLAEILFSMSMEQGAEYIKEHYSLDKTVSEIMTGIRGMLRDFYFYEVKAKPGAAELMKIFRDEGVVMTAATSSPREHIEAALERNGLLIYIDRLFTCGEEGTSKHEPDIYHTAAKHMGTEPSETLVFEDSLYALRTAAAAGYATIGVFDEKGEADQTGLESSSDFYVRELPEALAVLNSGI